MLGVPDCCCDTVTVVIAVFDGSAVDRTVMVAVPGVIARTNPAVVTVAIAVDDVVQVTAVLLEPVTVAVSVCCAPDVSASVAALTEMLTGVVGTIVVTDSE